MRKLFFLFLLAACIQEGFAQPASPVVKETIKKNREKLYSYLVNNTINKNLSLPLSDSTEDRWQDAFYALELIGYSNDWVNGRIGYAVAGLQNRSASFQQSLLELLYTNYPGRFDIPVKTLFNKTENDKLFAMSGEYLLKSDGATTEKNAVRSAAKKRLLQNPGKPILDQLAHAGIHYKAPSPHTLLKPDYLPGNVLMISFQRKNRDYPGLVLVRNANGSFVKDTTGNFFSVPQLARSISNLPGYITNGNTPEGILRMDGFDVSKGSMIGPTTNVQLTLPFEYNAFHFYRDSTLADTIGNITLYKNLLPKNFRDHYPMYQSFYAGMAGRSEIIAHGTTVDPAYYLKQPYYPLTPTVGCLCTKEIWNEQNGTRKESDQQLLVNAISIAGGPYGYAIVINIDDQQSPVTLKDILPYLKLAGQK
jgi:hypothetical protein